MCEDAFIETVMHSDWSLDALPVSRDRCDSAGSPLALTRMLQFCGDASGDMHAAHGRRDDDGRNEPQHRIRLREFSLLTAMSEW